MRRTNCRTREVAVPEALGRRPGRYQLVLVAVVLSGFVGGWLVRGVSVGVPAQAVALACGAQATGLKDAGRTLAQWLECSDADLEHADPLEIDLAVARSIKGIGEINVAVYAAKLDGWAAHVRMETDRHLYRFQQAPGEYKDSLAYFEALVMVTVVGQDFGVSYETDAVAFDDPGDLFVHGAIDRKRGTCVSLPVLYMALGHRLG